MRITVVGTGYVGLVAAVCLAVRGHDVVAVDREEIVRGLKEGKPGIWEPGLDGMLTDAVGCGRLTFGTDIARAAIHADALMIAVGTPSMADGSVDMRQLRTAFGELLRARVCPKLVIIKSTVPIGTCEEWETILRREGFDTEVAYNPEFMRQGSAIRDFLEPARIVLGCGSPVAAERLRRLYAAWNAPLHLCGRRSAEMIKYASNAFLAMKISFANMMADLCEGYGADIREVVAGVGFDKRIGGDYMQAGVGYGGSCLPKDLQALLAAGRAIGCPLPLLEAAKQVNDRRIPALFDKLLASWEELPMAGKRLTVFGLSFKPNTGDLRDAPSLAFLSMCLTHGIDVCAYDPVVRSVPLPGVHLASDPYEAVAAADAVVIMTEWPQLAALDWHRIASAMRTPIVLDGRNALPKDAIARLLAASGAKYVPTGHPASSVRPTPALAGNM